MDFFSLLSMYYACDQATHETVLSHRDATICTQIYASVKQQFLTSDDITSLETADQAARAALLQLAYLRFKDWEAQNGSQVRDLREASLSHQPRG